MRHKEVLAGIYDKLTLLETSRSNYKQAFAYLELKHKYEDSIYTEKQTKQIADAEARYDADKKDQTIGALEQQKQISKSEATVPGYWPVDHQRHILYYIYASAVP